MDAAEFEKRARDPALNREQLETLKVNALAKGNREFAAIANEVFLDRFPTSARKRGGATPTTTNFDGRTEYFSTGKDAYLWLVQRFRERRQGLLESQDRWHQRAFEGKTRRYFAASPRELFPEGSAQLEQAGNCSELPGGWYANVNLNHGEKFDILLRLAAICQLKYPDDWDFRITGATKLLTEKQAAVVFGERLLEELRNL